MGACIINKNNIIVSIGYNGFPKNYPENNILWSKENKQFYVVHAEANAILNSYSKKLKMCKLYTTLFPCNECAKLIIQSGIKKIYYINNKNNKKYNISSNMFDSMKIKYKKINININKLVNGLCKINDVNVLSKIE